MITLGHGDWSLTLRPNLGAAITRLRWRELDILRPASDDIADPLATGSFPLAPYANRIAGGAFRFNDETVVIPATPGFEPHALHGVAWRRDWTVLRSDSRSVVLVLACEPSPDWPWAWTATHRLSLDDDGLALDLKITNGASGPMPAGLGLHPYFATDDATVLTVPAPLVWLNGADQIPERLAQASDLIDWSAGAGVAGAPFVDNAYAEWSGVARLEHPGHVVEMTGSPNARWVQIYAPGASNFVCVEPVTHRPDAHNAAADEDSGLTILDLGQSLTVSARINAHSRMEL